ncbi:MAG: ArsR/SmtB family transcription factor [Anaerolineae bacterium]
MADEGSVAAHALPRQQANEWERALPMLRGLADRNRLRILSLLRDGELCVCNLMAALDISQALVSHHLSVLRAAGLVRERRAGRWVYYSLEPGALQEAASFLDDLAHVARTAVRPDRPLPCDAPCVRPAAPISANSSLRTHMSGGNP